MNFVVERRRVALDLRTTEKTKQKNACELQVNKKLKPHAMELSEAPRQFPAV